MKDDPIFYWRKIQEQHETVASDPRYTGIRTAKQLNLQLEQYRRDYLKANHQIGPLLRHNGQTNERVVRAFAWFLAEMCDASIAESYGKYRLGETKDFAYYFYYYCSQLFAHDKVRGTLDDYIRLAWAYSSRFNTVEIIWQEDLPEEYSAEAMAWIAENPPPQFFTEGTTAAVAIFCGILPEPAILNREG